MNRVLGIGLLWVMIAGSGDAVAQQSEDLGDYVVHYNALNTDQIPPQMAQAYGIRRSSNQAMLNVTVLKKGEDNTETPMHAQVSAHTVNLTGQRRNLKIREIDDAGGGVYYIATFPVYNQETISFNVNIGIEGLEEPALIKFRKQFYTE